MPSIMYVFIVGFFKDINSRILMYNKNIVMFNTIYLFTEKIFKNYYR